MASVSVTINGRGYRMACDEGEEEHLAALAEKFDDRVNQLKSAVGEIGDQRLTVMAGIMVTDELTELQKKTRKLESRIKSLEDKAKAGEDAANTAEAEAAAKIAQLAERLAEITGKLNGKAATAK